MLEDLALIEFLVSGLLVLIVFPLVYDFIIIPRIEKRLNKKLKYNATYNKYPLWMVKYQEVSVYIMMKHIFSKLNIQAKKLRFENFALSIANYDIKEASNFEIFFSYFTYLFCLQAIIVMAFWYFLIYQH